MFSYWQQDAFFGYADVLIVGAGFAGLWSAYELKSRQPNLKITVLDKEPFPGGASVRNAGFACFGSPGEMLADEKTMGEEAVWQTVAMRYQGIQKLRTVLGDAAIDYDACGGYECFADNTSFDPVAEKLDWLNKGMRQITGSATAFTVVDDELRRLGLHNFSHLLVNRLEGGLHSAKALSALLQKVTLLGVQVLFGMELLFWEKAGEKLSITARATKSFTLKAGQLLLATNAFTFKLTPTVPVQPARGQVLITEPIKGLVLKGTFHWDEGYYYWRNVGNRILLGGARNNDFNSEHSFLAEVSPSIQEALLSFLHRHIDVPPQQLQVAHCWAGIMGFTKTKQPVVQAVAPQVWAVIACNGIGVALTPVLAETVAQQLLS
jgi:gamma-glutamylputrescine oxidase